MATRDSRITKGSDDYIATLGNQGYQLHSTEDFDPLPWCNGWCKRPVTTTDYVYTRGSIDNNNDKNTMRAIGKHAYQQ